MKYETRRNHMLYGQARRLQSHDIGFFSHARSLCRDHFGPHNALDYLIGEKLFSFLRAAEQDPLFAAEVPDFIREIRRLFTAEVICDYLDRLEKTKYLDPLDPDLEMDEDKCAGDMLVLIRWQGHTMAIPLPEQDSRIR